MRKLTETEVSLMRHACGMDSKDPYYRDYFAADPGSDDDLAWAGLVSVNMASVRQEPNDWCPLRIYGVTSLGKQTIGASDQ